jgi:hypothetical protein
LLLTRGRILLVAPLYLLYLSAKFETVIDLILILSIL